MNVVIIGLAGNIGAGKSFVADALAEQVGNAARINFADPLYEMLHVIDPAIFQGMTQDAKLEPFAGNVAWTRRDALQITGTELFRHQVNSRIWVDAFDKRSTQPISAGSAVICADVRMPDEAEVIRSRGGMVLWISRPESEVVTSHSSGTSLTPELCDAVIDNSGDVQATLDAVMAAVNAFAISNS